MGKNGSWSVVLKIVIHTTLFQKNLILTILKGSFNDYVDQKRGKLNMQKGRLNFRTMKTFCPRVYLMDYPLPNVDNRGHLANCHQPHFVHVVIERLPTCTDLRLDLVATN